MIKTTIQLKKYLHTHAVFVHQWGKKKYIHATNIQQSTMATRLHCEELYNYLKMHVFLFTNVLCTLFTKTISKENTGT